MADNLLTVADTTELDKQTAYADALDHQGFDYSLAVVGSHFVESMRAIHYKSTATALNELVDNSIESGATAVHIALGFYGKSDAKPDGIAIIDDGHGMVPKMIRLSVLWGGTHRGEEKQRRGFGRFGFGLPSASVNQCRRFSVYSRVANGDWFGTTIDLDDIREGKYNTGGAFKVVAPEPEKRLPPKWVQDYIRNSMSGGDLKHGTIVVWEKLDRIKWSTKGGLHENVPPFLGMSYHNYLSKIDLRFDGVRIDPIDPLFTTPGYRLFDEDEDRAMGLLPAEIEVKSKLTGEKAIIRVRYARFPLTFFRLDKTKEVGTHNANARWKVKTISRGIIVSRMGRVIDTLEQTPWKGLEKFRNDDRYWAIEIDFPADLDEDFAIANNKQSVLLSERIWDILEQSGVGRNIAEFRYWISKEQKKDEVDTGNSDKTEKRPSEKALESTSKYARTRVGTDPIERTNRAREAFDAHVKGEARSTSQPVEEVRQRLEKDTKEHPYRVMFDENPGASFFRVEEIGGQKRLFINHSHRFFTDVYAAPGATPKVRNAIEVLLFVIGECELDAYANPDRKNFYIAERAAWSERLSQALDDLTKYFADYETLDTKAA